MTHELSSPADYNDYLAKVLAPATPLMVLGRSKDATPKIKGEEAMWFAWRTVVRGPCGYVFFHSIPTQGYFPDWQRSLPGPHSSQSDLRPLIPLSPENLSPPEHINQVLSV